MVFELPKTENNIIKYISPKLNGFSENFQLIHYTQKDINNVEQIRFFEDDLLWRVLVNGDLESYKLINSKLKFNSSIDIECRAGFQPKKNMQQLGVPIMKKLIEPTDFEQYYQKK